LAFAIAWEIANREEKLKVDKIWLTNNDCWLLIFDLVFLEPSIISHQLDSNLFLGFSVCHECTNFILNRGWSFCEFDHRWW
jgi:hypothetical protein